ncbi:MAG TPA: MBL fold metallo-hydrolase [Planctomycetota bacterium]|nr:MBL fold metallo-hydrolase [Planctomycetota bacterium]
MQIHFLGATGTVTGSKYLVRGGRGSVLVDCGLFQGLKQLRLRNWEPMPVDPKSISAVVLTHAHIDHSGYLPALVRDGFKGKVYCSPATRDLCGVLLPDSAHLQEEEARYANKKGYSKHHPARPLYTKKDAEAAISRLKAVPEEEEFEPAKGLTARLIPNGHILGSNCVHVTDRKASVLFSGDVGRFSDPLMKDPKPPPAAVAYVIESTYGGRNHPGGNPQERLREVVARTAKRGGVVIIPAFAIGRAQIVLFHLQQLKAKGRIPDVPLYLNSPMAIDATEIFARYAGEHDLDRAQCEAMCRAARFVSSVEESKALNASKGPKVIIASSGMATGGRVVHHIKAFGPGERNTILLTGFQAAGTRGARLAAGERVLRIHGTEVPIRAEVVQLEGLSAHADSDEMLRWLRGAPREPKITFLTHGEPVQADALRLRVQDELGWNCRVPDYLEQANLPTGTNQR